MLVLGFLASAADVGKPMKVDFINAIPAHYQFWDNLVGAMQTAAQQLEINFTNDVAVKPEEMVSEVTRLVNGPDRPDYLILSMHGTSHTTLLKIAEDAKVPVFVINAGLLEEDKKQYGGPREHFKYWIGQMLPDEERAGYDLARTLLDRAEESGKSLPGGSLEIMALGGREEDFPAVLRLAGLGRAVANDHAAALERIVPANWSQDEAKARTPLILERFPNTKVIWAANDAMALGVLAALEELGRHPGEDIFVGGIDWDDDAVKAVADGKLTATVGGHFMDGAWALVLLYDYHHGIDFASERTDWLSKMLPLTKETAKEYLNTFGVGNWRKVDFRSFSKSYNSGLKKYDFSLNKVLLDLKAAKKGEP